jgi:hypothetical protein
VNNLAPISNIGDVRHYSTVDVFNVGTPIPSNAGQ